MNDKTVVLGVGKAQAHGRTNRLGPRLVASAATPQGQEKL